MTHDHEAGKDGYQTFFVPMNMAPEPEAQKIKCAAEGGKEVPVHVLDMRTRADVLTEWLGDIGGAYKDWALSMVCFAATVAAYLWVHWTVAAALAYAGGYLFSRYILTHAWNVDWYKGKSMLYTE
jgi:hypothetical protein